MLSTGDRSDLRGRLAEPLEQLQHELRIAAQMAAGPDPEEALPVLRSLYNDLGELLIALASK